MAVTSADGKALETVSRMTGGRGVDTAIEAVGRPATFELCEEIVAPGGTIANIGVHGTQVALHLERLWDRNISITTRLVDTISTPMLLNVLLSHKIDPKSRSVPTRWPLACKVRLLNASDAGSCWCVQKTNSSAAWRREENDLMSRSRRDRDA
jgi:threonine dehydrogenase-like Zn-dependent dehydrogenase